MSHSQTVCEYRFNDEKKHFSTEVDEDKLFEKYGCGIGDKEYYEAIIKTQKYDLWKEKDCPFVENQNHIFVSVLMLMEYLGLEIEGVKIGRG